MLITFLQIICIMAITVIIHESGHFLLGKILGYGIDEYSIGVGPKIIQKQKNEILYTIKIIPIVAFVKFSEDNVKGKCIKNPGISKIIVFFAGALFNFIFAILIFAFSSMLKDVNFLDAIYKSFEEFIQVIKNMIFLLFHIDKLVLEINNNILEKGINNSNFFNIIAQFNILDGMMNLFPISMLDGGKIIISIVELILHREISQKAHKIINSASRLILYCFEVYLVSNIIL